MWGVRGGLLKGDTTQALQCDSSVLWGTKGILVGEMKEPSWSVEPLKALGENADVNLDPSLQSPQL